MPALLCEVSIGWLVSTGGNAPPGDIYQRLESHVGVTMRGQGATGTRWGEIRDAAKQPMMHRTAPPPTTKSDLAPQGAKAGKTLF